MKYMPSNEYLSGTDRVELSRRNLTTLLAKLDDPLSARTLVKQSDNPCERSIMVIAVEDDEHYAERLPGPVYMPSSGEYL